MIRTLKDVIADQKGLLARLDRANWKNPAKGGPGIVYDHAYMENVMVIPDAIALRLAEALYIHGTHFVPGRLPGDSMAIGDIITKDGEQYLTIDWRVLDMNVVMLHAARAYETECAVQAALTETARGSKGNVKKLAELEEKLRALRSRFRHKGLPEVSDGLLILDSPSASGGASWHSNVSSDDVANAVPGDNTLFMVGCQAGRTGVQHIGAGHVLGKTFVICLPKQPLLDIQARIDTDAELKNLWKKVAKVDKEYANVISWYDSTLAHKEHIVREAAPAIIRDRVLGFHVDVTDNGRGASLSPVVAQSHLSASGPLPDGMRPKQLPFAEFLMETRTGYDKVRSLFDGASAAA